MCFHEQNLHQIVAQQFWPDFNLQALTESIVYKWSVPAYTWGAKCEIIYLSKPRVQFKDSSIEQDPISILESLNYTLGLLKQSVLHLAPHTPVYPELQLQGLPFIPNDITHFMPFFSCFTQHILKHESYLGTYPPIFSLLQGIFRIHLMKQQFQTITFICRLADSLSYSNWIKVVKDSITRTQLVAHCYSPRVTQCPEVWILGILWYPFYPIKDRWHPSCWQLLLGLRDTASESVIC